jgi:hypothetical protein
VAIGAAVAALGGRILRDNGPWTFAVGVVGHHIEREEAGGEVNSSLFSSSSSSIRLAMVTSLTSLLILPTALVVLRMVLNRVAHLFVFLIVSIDAEKKTLVERRGESGSNR